MDYFLFDSGRKLYVLPSSGMQLLFINPSGVWSFVPYLWKQDGTFWIESKWTTVCVFVATYFTDNSGAFMAQRREDTPGCETHSNHVSIKCQANFKQTLKKKVNMVHFHKLIYINELGQVKCNLVRGWGSVGYIMCGCGSKQTRGKQTRRLNRERSAGIMTGQDVIVLS